MSKSKQQWNPTSWPWELELITLAFFLIALLMPVYFSVEDEFSTIRELQEMTAANDFSAGNDILHTQTGFLWAIGIVALYVMHVTFSRLSVDRITASPLHLISPIVFALLAYNRVDNIPNLQGTALDAVDGSIGQMIVLVLFVGLLTSILARLRKYRYMLDFDDVQWDINSPAVYDTTYFSLIMLIRPLLCPPRRYRACREGILIEGWFYAAPIAFSDIRAIAALNSASTTISGQYYASSTKHLIRMELHDSLKPTFISPADRDGFIRYCVQHVARKRPKQKANSTRHDMLHAADTQAGQTHAGDTHTPSATRH